MKETKQDLVVGTNVIGQPIYITKYEIDSEKNGKVFYLQGGIHGGEITLHMIREIYDFVKANIVTGKVIFIPFANPIGWLQKSYTYTVGKFNDKTGEDFNRTFGKSGIGNTMVQISNKILDVCKDIDFAVDLHTAHTSFPHTISFTENDMKYIKMANIEYNRLCYGTEEYKSTLNYQLSTRGINNFTIECGSHDDINAEYQDQTVCAVLNVMKELGIINKAPIREKKNQVSFSKSTSYYAQIGGIVDFKKSLGESFKKGDILYTIKPANLQEKEYVQKAEFDGIIFRFAKTHIYNSHDEIMRVFKLEDLQNI